jgi:hypothetical protein
LNSSKNFLRVSVWGADDFGMELDMYPSKNAIILYNNWANIVTYDFPNPLTIKYLEQIGFMIA